MLIIQENRWFVGFSEIFRKMHVVLKQYDYFCIKFAHEFPRTA